MRRLFLLGVLLFPVMVCAQQIYKRVDSDGVVHFSDRPGQGAESVKLPAEQVYRSSKSTASESKKSYKSVTDADLLAFPPPMPADLLKKKETTTKPQQYKELKIIDPENEGSVRDNEGRVSIVVALTPPLAKGDKVVALIDGKPMGQPKASTVINLTGLDRGTHHRKQ